MNGTAFGNLRLYTGSAPAPPPLSVAGTPVAVPPADPHALGDRELIRAPARRRPTRGPEPLSAAWLDEIERRRYARHGAWLDAALEFGRHPGESVLLLNPGLGMDAGRFARQGTEVTVAAGPADHPEFVRANLRRMGVEAKVVPAAGPALPFADGAFDVVVWNALHQPAADPAATVEGLFRVLKFGGKVIALFPARYDAGYWQDLTLPLQHLFWRRPPDPTTTAKTSARDLRRLFADFADHRVLKRHLRRAELPHLWRLLPLAALERVMGRVLVLKAFRPIPTGRTAATPALGSPPLAA